MRQPLLRLFEERIGDDEIIADLFAGGGGASTGIEMAIGRSPDIAMNHDKTALGMHQINHPTTDHLHGDVFHYDPDRIAQGRRFAFAWFSPDCTYHSKAKGGKPFRDKSKSLRIRGLAWVMVRWAESQARPRVLFMENVEEIEDWGPLVQVADNEYRPDPAKRGTYWRRLVSRLKRAGYGTIEWRRVRADHYGSPTKRTRLIMIARCDGRPIVWPAATHAQKPTSQQQPWRTAAECIDFSIPVPSIFLSPAEAKAWGKAHGVPAPRRPLAPATCRRIARGTVRYVLNAADPFIIPVMHQGDDRVHSVHEPIRTITTTERGEFAVVQPFLAGVGGRMGQSGERPVVAPYHTTTGKADTVLVAPTLINTRNGERHGKHGEQAPRVLDIKAPFNTITAHGSQGALAVAHLTRFNSERSTGSVRGQSMTEPLSTLDTSNRFGLVSAFLAKHNGGHEATGQQLSRPSDTITTTDTKALVTARIVRADALALEPALAEQAVRCYAFLVKFFGTGVARPLDTPAGTLTTKDRMGLVVVVTAKDGEDYVLVDIGMRMLTPRELFSLQGFPESYIIDHALIDGQRVKLTKGTQTRLVGNSVPPHLAAAIIAANLEAIA